ncbi:SPFH domain-containing protein [Ancylomarina longa]|uniref:SPFH domain-containing protein n=1 Tax=Ancylomarina longa TaxID=2487017 RepID=A0A434AZX8_9BACT|nr:SPFH domain-containing protein [Ancylomarina longa]RUT80065.1 SPFH domain-containing protein [Ancylomarina longa]
METEKKYSAVSGFLMVFVVFAIIALGVLGLAIVKNPVLAILFVVGIICIPGFTVVNPNESMVLVLFGAYKGTILKNGFFWVNPLFVKKKISLRARNLDSDPIKVNDKIGNPIMIGVVLVWRVKDTFKAAFDVNDYEHFVNIQSEAAIRNMAGSYPYDNFEDEGAEITLRSGGDDVSELLESELTDRLTIAGIEIMEARINYLAYASEIAGAMLRRQQATAVVAARFKIVEGAVSMVDMALEELTEKNIVDLDEDKKATMVSNLMVVLCSDKDATPVLNTGSLYQ